MKKQLIYSLVLLLSVTVVSCSKDIALSSNEQQQDVIPLERLTNRIVIDSAYAYIGDSIYNSWLNIYNSTIRDGAMTKSLSPEDEAFFNRQHIVKSTEALLLYGRVYIYPGAILEANSISEPRYEPVLVENRNPITVSMTLTHKTPKSTIRQISAPSYSKLDEYVKEMAIGGNFEQNEKFMFQAKRFTFYDEIKSAFGTNINTRKLFSSKKTSSTEEREKIVKSSGMYVKFYQSSFTVNVDIAPLSNKPIKGKTNLEPVYVSSVTYGRLGILVIESDETYEFAEKCINKAFNKVLYKKKTTFTEEERLFFEKTNIEVLIIGANSDFNVHTINGYDDFANVIYDSKFTETSFGVPISCTFSYANTHGLVETEFVNNLQIEPLFVHFSKENSKYSSGENNNYHSSADRFLNFYKDRQKTTPAYPYTDIVFEIEETTTKWTQYHPGMPDRFKPGRELEENKNNIKVRNIELKPRLYVGREESYYQSDGPEPGPNDQWSLWRATQYSHRYQLKPSPFFIIL